MQALGPHHPDAFGLVTQVIHGSDHAPDVVPFQAASRIFTTLPQGSKWYFRPGQEDMFAKGVIEEHLALPGKPS